MTGFTFIPNWESLANMTTWFIDLLKTLKKHEIISKYKMDMINEMTLIKAYMDSSDEICSILTMPFGVFYFLSGFNSIFDPASWGQFVGGTLGEGPGAKPKDHYIGPLLLQHPEYTVIWKKDALNRNIPYFKYDNKEVKINNLHIHSKNLSKYVSISE